MTAAAMRGVRRCYGGNPPVDALEGVDLDVAPGEVVAVLGPSGCGKSTLLRVLAGTERPDGGTVSIAGVQVAGPGVHVPPERRKVGLVPQEGALFPHLDVAGNVAFGLARGDRAERARRVGEMLDLVGLSGYERRRPHQLSGGQQQRVALARALAPRPTLVLLDEPFSALDTALRASLRLEVAAVLREAGTTALLVTHDQSEALSVADSVAVMRAGRIMQHASPEDVYHRASDEWTARFVGAAVTMPGTYEPGEHATVTCALGALPVAAAAGADAVDAGAVTAFVRPEQIWPSDRPGAVESTVVGTRFEGSEVVVDLAVGAMSITARWSTAHVRPEVGDTISVTVVGDALVFPKDPNG